MTFTVALFAILETGNSPKQPSMSECGWAKKATIHPHNGKLLNNKKNKLFI